MYENITTAVNTTRDYEFSFFDILLNWPSFDFVLLAWITGITMIIMEIFILTGNGLVIAAVLIDPLKNIIRRPSNHFVLSLALAVVGAAICFFTGWWHIVVAIYKEDLFGAGRNKSGVGEFHLVAISTANLLALCIDRLIAIKTPLQYSYKVTKRKVRIVIVRTWGYFTGLSSLRHLLPLIDEDPADADFIFNCHCAVAFLALVVICLLVIRFLRKQTTAMKKQSDNYLSLRNAVERERKVARGFIVLTLVFIACFVPFFIYHLLEYIFTFCWNKATIAQFLIIFRNASLMLVFFNSLINPYLYALRLPNYSETFKYFGKKLFICRKRRASKASSAKLSQREISSVSLVQISKL